MWGAHRHRRSAVAGAAAAAGQCRLRRQAADGQPCTSQTQALHVNMIARNLVNACCCCSFMLQMLHATCTGQNQSGLKIQT